jgi:asparagine synthase (glutamine-hydrolysing)
MCGITGYIKTAGDCGFNLKKSLQSINHRGPDASGIKEWDIGESKIGLAHARLSIIDTTDNGTQPMKSYTLNTEIVFNGEIYNYKALRAMLIDEGCIFKTNTDTEVILNGYERFGVSFINQLRGMFSVCLIDNASEIAHIFRDRVGVKPLYVYEAEGIISFSSEMRGLISGLNLSWQVENQRFFEYLNYGYISEGGSILRGIGKILPGEILTIDLRTFLKRRYNYWRAQDIYSGIKYTKYQDTREAVKDSLIESVALRMVADVDVGVFLSGGYDSATVAAIATKELGISLPAFTIGFDDPSYDESRDAANIARHLGIRHEVKVCTPRDCIDILADLPDVYDEPFGDSSSIPTILLSKFSRSYVKVAMSADGGDELFGGYRKYHNALKLVDYSKRLGFAAQLLHPSLARIFYSTIQSLRPGVDLTPEVLAKIINIIRSNPTPAAAANNIEYSLSSEAKIKKYLNPDLRVTDLDRASFSSTLDRNSLQRMFLQDILYYLPSDILVKVDRASMHFGLEAREPLIDHKLLEIASGISPDLLMPNGGKALLRDICHDYIPKNIMDRKKKGFGVPVRAWMRGELKYFFDEVFFAKNDALELFDVSALRKAVAQYYAGDNSDFNFLWYVFCFVRWREKYL